MPIRLSGLLANIPAPNAAVGAFYFATDEGDVYVSDGNEWNERMVLDHADVAGNKSGSDANKPDPRKAIGWIYHATDTRIKYEAFPTAWHVLVSGEQPSLVDLCRWVSGQFSTRFQSTGELADIAQTRVLLTATDASPENPYLIRFDQVILTPFTGPGKFDLQERDASDMDVIFFDCITVSSSPLLTSVGDNFTVGMVGDIVTCAGVPVGTTVLSYQNPKQVTLSANATASAPAPGIQCSIGGKTEVTLATKDGFTDGVTSDGWSRFIKVTTGDKYYKVAFVPGTTGDGVYSLRLSRVI